MTITKEMMNPLDSCACVCRVFFKTNDGTPMKLEYMNNGPQMLQFVKSEGEWKVVLTNADVGVEYKPLRWSNYEGEWAKIKDAFFATFREVLGFAFGEE